MSKSRQNSNIFFCFFFAHTYYILVLARCTYEAQRGLHANIELGERQQRVPELRRPITERLDDKGEQDSIVKDLRRRLPMFSPSFYCSVFSQISLALSSFVPFRKSVSWPSSIITVNSPWCRRRCASSLLPRDRSLMFYALKKKHNI